MVSSSSIHSHEFKRALSSQTLVPKKDMPNMTKYVAFLRGINVGGHKPVKMDELSRMFTSCGFENVRTYIQSGNVWFESAAQESETFMRPVEQALQRALGFEVAVFVRSVRELQALVKADPFAAHTADADATPYVTFVAAAPKPKPTLPLVSPNGDVEVFAIRRRDVCSLSHAVKGRNGFPNLFVEKTFGVLATTRNWNTVVKMAS